MDQGFDKGKGNAMPLQCQRIVESAHASAGTIHGKEGRDHGYWPGNGAS